MWRLSWQSLRLFMGLGGRTCRWWLLQKAVIVAKGGRVGDVYLRPRWTAQSLVPSNFHCVQQEKQVSSTDGSPCSTASSCLTQTPTLPNLELTVQTNECGCEPNECECELVAVSGTNSVSASTTA